MSELAWSWLALPYVLCTASLLALIIVAGVLRGDRVMRLGVIGAATTALPWAVCSGLSACTRDPDVATNLLRLGQGPVSFVGPNFMLVLLGISGQLERHRWLARVSGMVGAVFLVLCWGTDWTVPGVQLLPSGLLYTRAGPLTDLHLSQLLVWLLIGAYIARIASSRGEKRRLLRLMLGLLGLAAIGAADMALVKGIWGIYPVAWLPAIVCALFTIRLCLKTDLLRPQGVDRGAVLEVYLFLAAALVIGGIALLLEGAAPVILATAASIVWVVGLGIALGIARRAPPRQVAGERELARFVGSLADVEDEVAISTRLGELWSTWGIAVRTTWRVDSGTLVDVTTGAAWAFDPEAHTWLVQHAQALAPTDLATMRLGAIRPKLEAVASAHGASLVVPLVDRGVLVGLVEAEHANALREEERELVAESARAAARALTYAALARAAAKEGATAREVEVAEALRLQAAASRDDELGRWSVAAEYRTAPRTTGAGWSTTLLHDGRLAVLVTEAQAHGVAAALATAAITGAFAAATVGDTPLQLDDVLASMRASAEGVLRGGEPIAAFLAIVDGERNLITWATAGHPGAFVVTRDREVTTLGGDGASVGASLITATRGQTTLPPDGLLVIASTGLRDVDDKRFVAQLRAGVPAGLRLAQVLVDGAVKRGELVEDLLAVVLRQRQDRRSEPVIIATPEPA